MEYIDANVFVYAAIDSGALGPKAQRLIRDAIAGTGACTSSLTVDEVLWAVKKKLKNTRQAGDIARKLLRMPITILPVERRDVEDAIARFEGGLDPRDAVHAAVAVRNACTVIVSDDPAFSAVKGLRHVPLK